MNKIILKWILSMMVSVSPIQKQTSETQEEVQERYESIGNDIITVSNEEDPLYTDDNDRIKTMSVMLSIAYFESNFRKDVDDGSLRGDSGNSWCLAQINLSGGKILILKDSFKYLESSSKDGWSGKDLVLDRKKCFKAQLAILHESYKCNVPEYMKLKKYASGSCNNGSEASYVRMKKAHEFMSSFESYNDIAEVKNETVLFKKI